MSLRPYRIKKITKIWLSLFFVIIVTSLSYGDQMIKEPNVSGQFYSENPNQLSQQIDSFFASANIEASDRKVDIIISPHAGYIYSGGVAAYGFKAASQGNYKTIIVIAPSHFHGFEGVSVWPKGTFKTPLGAIEIDQEFSEKLTALSDSFSFEPQAFDREHSLEVELPFLQKIFKNFKLVPIVMGHPNLKVCQELASSLNEVVGDREDVLLVASTDMSHYHEGTVARSMDASTLNAIKELKAEQLFQQCLLRRMELCGVSPVTTSLLYAKHRSIEGVDVLKYADSGDVSGDKRKVVGYTSIIFYKQKNNQEAQKDTSQSSLTLDQKRRLIHIAKETIQQYVKTGKAPVFDESDPRFLKKEGAFVTIHKHGRLRGCIGHIIGRLPLYQTVTQMAIAAATQDHRFVPVTQKELDDVDVEISVLSEPKQIQNVDEIKMGIHGVIVGRGPFNRGVFLPQVATETGWTKEEFLSQLCSQKAGLPGDCWKDPNTKIEIFSAEVFSEGDVKE